MRLLALFLALSAPAAAADLTAKLDAMLSTGAFAGARTGVIFVSLGNGATPYAHDADEPLIPASVAKLATSAAAHETLGPEFRFRTSFLVKKKELGRKRVSVLVWRGDGDPSISGRDRSHLFEVFELWRASFTAIGLESADRLVVDGRAFEAPAVSPHWPADEMSYWYQAQTSAVTFNDACVDLRFRPGPAPGAPAVVELSPDFGYVQTVNHATTSAPGVPFTLDYRREPGANRVEFFASIPAGSAPRVDYVAVHDPGLYAAHTLRAVWKDAGPKVDAIAPWETSGLKDEDLVEVFAWDSPALPALIKVVNTNSQNLYAEHLLKTLGRRVEGKGSFDGGAAVVRRFLARIGLSDADHHLVDGSGLAEGNRLTARAVVRVLTRMKDVPAYVDSLGRPGVDKSVKNRLKSEPLADRMRVKGGTVRGARNLAGYLESRSGRRYAFAILVNGLSLNRPAVDAAIDRLLIEAVASLP